MTAPEGFASLFPGWNVWSVWQKNDLDFEPLMVGLDPDRRLRLWVEQVASSAPGAAVADPANPLALRGSQVEIIPSAAGLSMLERKEMVPGTALLLDGTATLKFVRFFNRGVGGVVPWPHDANYLVDGVFQPSEESPITSAPPPDSLAGAADKAAQGISTVVKVVAGVAGVALVVLLFTKLATAGRAVAA